MKNKVIVAVSITCLAVIGLTTNAVAQNAPCGKGNGKGYGGPPQSQEERAARQADCLSKNGGVCPNGGPQSACTGERKGQGNGNGKGFQNGKRDGTGPRSANGTCPLNKASAK